MTQIMTGSKISLTHAVNDFKWIVTLKTKISLFLGFRWGLTDREQQILDLHFIKQEKVSFLAELLKVSKSRINEIKYNINRKWEKDYA